MSKIKVSVIVPIYNVMRYLPICMDSILSQSLSEIELICVDDGSTDESGKILDEYAGRDERIKVIHKENTGYGNSMNVGIDAAKGEYIGIVESDDAILPNFFSTLYKTVKAHDLDIVKSECFLWWEKYEYKYRLHREYMDRYFGKVINRDRQFLRCSFLMNTWSGLYRREFLTERRIKHHESGGASYQDNGFWMQGMLFADKVMFLDYAGYMYRQDNDSASIKDRNKVYAMADEYKWLYDNLKDRLSYSERQILNGFRLTRSYFAIFRIADELKRDFCDRIIADYAMYGEAFVRDLAWQDIFEDISMDPDGFCQRIIEAKNRVKKAIEGSDAVIIYGAGQRGERIYRILCDYGWETKLQCFIETSVPLNKMIGRTPVYNIDDDRVCFRNVTVIISSKRTSKWYTEMNDRLCKKKPLLVIDSEDIIENFYSLS